MLPIPYGDAQSLAQAQAAIAAVKAQASGLASLDANSLVVQNPANAVATATASKIPLRDASGDIAVLSTATAGNNAIGKTEAGVRISHAWVLWRNEGRWWLLDCTLKNAPIPADSLPENRYIPLYSYSKGSTFRHSATQVGLAQVASKRKSPVASN
jgi:hypothetical protein